MSASHAQTRAPGFSKLAHILGKNFASNFARNFSVVRMSEELLKESIRSTIYFHSDEYTKWPHLDIVEVLINLPVEIVGSQITPYHVLRENISKSVHKNEKKWTQKNIFTS